MNSIEFGHRGDRYRIDLAGDLLTMSQRQVSGWIEIARLTIAAAGVLADLDGVVEDRPRLATVDDG